MPVNLKPKLSDIKKMTKAYKDMERIAILQRDLELKDDDTLDAMVTISVQRELMMAEYFARDFNIPADVDSYVQEFKKWKITDASLKKEFPTLFIRKKDLLHYAMVRDLAHKEEKEMIAKEEDFYQRMIAEERWNS